MSNRLCLRRSEVNTAELRLPTEGLRINDNTPLAPRRFIIVVPTGKLMAQYVPDVREFERIRRMRNGVVHGVESVDPADLHDAANRLHEIVEEVIRRSQNNPPV